MYSTAGALKWLQLWKPGSSSLQAPCSERREGLVCGELQTQCHVQVLMYLRYARAMQSHDCAPQLTSICMCSGRAVQDLGPGGGAWKVMGLQITYQIMRLACSFG
jgi:hypothetical protein